MRPTTPPADPGTPWTSVNPADLADVVAERRLAGAGEFVGAVRAAHEAQAGWARRPAPQRGRVLANVGRLVEANKQALARVVTREVGKPYAEALGEVQEVIDTCDFFLGEGRRLYGQTVPSEMPDKHLFTYRKPLGTAVVVTAANFPAAVPAWYLVPALLCGNTVVWKPSESAMAVADALASLFRAGGVPENVLRVVHTDGATAYAGLGEALDEGLVQKIGFTGSTAVGRRVAELAGRHLQAPCLELGGKNPLVVAEDADLELAVQGALFSAFATAGQRCTSMGTAFVHRAVHARFMESFVRAAENLVVGDPTQDVFYGPLIGERYLEDFLKSLDLVQGHHTPAGSTATGRITSQQPRKGFVGDPDIGLYVHPTVVDGVRPDDALYRQETFGPLVGVAVFDHLDEAVELANGHGYGLSAALYTRSPATAFSFRERCSAGMLSINNSTVGAEAHLPFGGNGMSGNGSRQSGIWVLDQFTSWQSVNWDHAGSLQKAQMDVDEVPADMDFRLK
ncbi:aldehyde dehydrogenase family protein [Streptomyces sp. RKND-216]|uniref:aldehyde dehydrogenase family protein n=1 Tax=Streptomyces sp. RKND-216 TaxID=2562581 RepID=UPI00109E0A4B|nr:aldehyde dehydrogenase family protein [Streptomyces sp. RKND-216]THA25962.1 aldehyde dehydrogenase family protein [Streptomyces sp. RKND-216]